MGDIKRIEKAVDGCRALFGDEKTFNFIIETFYELGEQAESLGKENEFLKDMLDKQIGKHKLTPVKISQDEMAEYLHELMRDNDEVRVSDCEGCICSTCEKSEEECKACRFNGERCDGCTYLDESE